MTMAVGFAIIFGEIGVEYWYATRKKADRDEEIKEERQVEKDFDRFQKMQEDDDEEPNIEARIEDAKGRRSLLQMREDYK